MICKICGLEIRYTNPFNKKKSICADCLHKMEKPSQPTK